MDADGLSIDLMAFKLLHENWRFLQAGSDDDEAGSSIDSMTKQALRPQLLKSGK